MTPNPTQLMNLKLKDIIITETNPRRNFDEESIKELAASIKEKGVLQPILVRAIGKAGKHELVCGERRLRAAKIAGLREIPAIVRILTDEEALEVQIIENLQRKDIHPMEEAGAFLTLTSKNKLSLQDIARRIGKTPQYVGWRMKLNEMIPLFQKTFCQGRMKLQEAFKVARISKPDQNALWDERDYAQDTDITFSEWELKKYLNKLNNAPFDIADATLKKDIGACTTCQYNSAANTVLFPESAHSAICTFSQCFKQKCNISYDREFKKASADATIELVTTSHNPGKEIRELQKKGVRVLNKYDHFETIEAPDRPEPEEYTVDNFETKKEAEEALEGDTMDYNKAMNDYNKAVLSGKYARAFVVEGDDKGKYIHIKIKKDKKGIPAGKTAQEDPVSEQKEDMKETIRRIHEREKRMKELDEEKLQPEYYKALSKHADFTESKAEILEEEKIALIVLLAKHSETQSKIHKIIGLSESDYSCVRLFFHLDKNRVKVRLWYNQAVRAAMLIGVRSNSQNEGARPDHDGISACLDMLTEFYCGDKHDSLHKAMMEERKAREERSKQRIEVLQKKLKSVKK